MCLDNVIIKLDEMGELLKYCLQQTTHGHSEYGHKLDRGLNHLGVHKTVPLGQENSAVFQVGRCTCRIGNN